MVSTGSLDSEPTPPAPAKKPVPVPSKRPSAENGGGIEKIPYYHGLLPREDVRLILKENGDFLVRISEPKPGEARSYILSVLADKNAEEMSSMKHVVISSGNGKYWFNKASFDSIQALVDYYKSPGAQSEINIKMVRPIPRQPWELEHDWIVITKKLGEGAFGEVSVGVFKTKKMAGVQVAVKQAKLEKMGKEQIKEFMGEARHLREMNHPNIVKFYGVAVIQEPLYMVMELASDGALDSYLHKNPTLPLETRNEMILQAAWGLEYLHSITVLHRDIAARNCLYGNKQVKLSDFGLSRKGTFYQMDQGKKVPIRWLAIETLTTAVYSQKTDVWSYGVMCWEIYSGAQEPYSGMTAAEVNKKVREGLRLQLAPEVNPDIQSMVKSCWMNNANDRPTMTEISAILQRVTKVPKPNFAGSVSKNQKDPGVPAAPANAPKRGSVVVKKKNVGVQTKQTAFR